MTDSVGNAHATGNSGCTLTTDRCGHANSALALNNGYLTLPQGVYVASPFTFTVWVKKGSTVGVGHPRIFEFGNGPEVDNIILSWISDSVVFPLIRMSNLAAYTDLYGLNEIPTTQWTFLAVTFTGTTFTFYVDGIQVVQSTTSNIPRNVTRTNCYIGKSNWAEDGFSDGLVDEFKIYNRCFTASEILAANNTACS